jgi:hypothetical protein
LPFCVCSSPADPLRRSDYQGEQENFLIFHTKRAVHVERDFALVNFDDFCLECKFPRKVFPFRLAEFSSVEVESCQVIRRATNAAAGRRKHDLRELKFSVLGWRKKLLKAKLLRGQVSWWIRLSISSEARQQKARFYRYSATGSTRNHFSLSDCIIYSTFASS